MEHSVVSPVRCMETLCSREEALSAMQPTIVMFGRLVAEASTAGARIILFPEDGLSGFEFSDRDHMRPLLQTVPDPR